MSDETQDNQTNESSSIITESSFESKFTDDLRALARRRAIGTVRRAFSVLVLQLLDPAYDLEVAIHDTQYDGPHDQGIDACVVDNEEQAVSLYQFKCPDEVDGRLPLFSTRYDETALVELTNGFELIGAASRWRQVVQDLRSRGQQDTALRLQDLGELYRRATGRGYTVYLTAVVGGRPTAGARTYYQTWVRDGAEARFVTADDIFLHYKRRAIPEIPPPEQVEVTFVPGKFYYDRDGGVLAGQMPASAVKLLVKDRENALLGTNFRFYLGTRGKQGSVNKAIEKTLGDPVLRGKFHKLNNGVRIVVSSIDPVGDITFRLGRPRIVNGGQTSATIRRADDEDLPNEVTVDVKILVASLGEAEAIAKSTNTQESVEGWDFHANEALQRSLWGAFKTLRVDGVEHKHWWDIKRGEFGSLSPSERSEYRIPGRRLYYRLDPDTLCKATLAFTGDPVSARSNPRLFPQTEGNGKYRIVFGIGRTPEEFLFHYYTYRALDELCKSFSKEYDDAESQNFAGILEHRKLELQSSRWLKYGASHMTALIGFLLVSRYGELGRDQAIRLMRNWEWGDPQGVGHEIPRNPVLRDLFGLVRSLTRTWARLKQEPEGFDWSNFFKESDSFARMRDELIIQLAEPDGRARLDSLLPVSSPGAH